MRQTDQKAVGSLFSTNSTYMFNKDFSNIEQLAWDIKWTIAGDETTNKDILRVKMFAELMADYSCSRPCYNYSYMKPPFHDFGMPWRKIY